MPAPISRPLVLVLLLVDLTLLLHCDLAPVYVKPATVTAPAYKEAPPPAEGWKVAEPRDRARRGAWWEAFHDADLDALERQVEGANQSVAVALAHFQAARALVSQSRAGYFPTVGVTPGVTRSRQFYTPAPGVAPTAYTSTQFSLPFDATWEADLWGRVRNSVKASDLEAQATLADLDNVRLAMQAEVAVAYFQIRVLDGQQELLTRAVTENLESLQLTRIQEDSGMASGQEVEQASTLLDVTLVQATDLGVQRAQFEHALATLVGRSASSFSLARHPLNVHLLPIPAGLPSELLERRPDIAAAERRVAEANAQIGVARAAYFPTATLGATAGFQNTVLGDLISGPNLLWSVGASLGQTLFDGGRRKAVTEQARAVYLGTVASYRQTVLSAFQDVEDQLSNLTILAVELRQQDQAVASAQRYLVIARTRYQAGVDIYLDVITAQTSVLSNQRLALTLRLQQLVASVQLIKALGGDLAPATPGGPAERH